MCLVLTSTKPPDLSWLSERRQFKLYRVRNVPLLIKALETDEPICVFRFFQDGYEKIQKGKAIRSDRWTGTVLTAKERFTLSVEHGLHTYVHLADAKRQMSNAASCVVLEVEARPEDFVADGKFCSSESSVYHRLYPVKVAASREWDYRTGRYAETFYDL